MKGLPKHLEQVESKFYVFADVMSYGDYRRVSDAMKNINQIFKLNPNNAYK